MLPVLIRTPWFNVYSYGLLMAVGYALATWWILRVARRDGLDPDPIFDMLIVMMVVGVLGARLAFMLEQWLAGGVVPPFWAIEAGGLTFYGAWLLSAAWCALFLRWKGMPFWRVMDAVGLGWPLGGALARLGCFLNGCCYGTPTEAWWGVVFPVPGPPPRIPVQLLEMCIYLLLFIGLQRVAPRLPGVGQTFVLSIAAYAAVRFPLEFWREENAPWWFGLTFSQWISIGLVVAGIVLCRQLPRWTGPRRSDLAPPPVAVAGGGAHVEPPGMGG